MIPKTSYDIPFTIIGGVSTGPLENGPNARHTLSGFTNDLTIFEFIPDALLPGVGAGGRVNADFISNDKFVWDLGDGTVVHSTSARHVYKHPGVYTVSLMGYTSAGEPTLSTKVSSLSVSDYLPTTLSHETKDIITTLNVPAGTKGTEKAPIKILRQTSWQPHKSLSAMGYTLSLYASGSRSRRLNVNQYNTDKWNHVDQVWSFYKGVTGNNTAIVDFIPVESVKTTTEDIYCLKEIKQGRQTFVRTNSSVLNTVSGISAIFVGTSGIADFYYGDDTPKLTDEPVLLFATLDSDKYPSLRHIYEGYNPPHSFNFLKYFEQEPLIIPARVKYNPGRELKFTPFGINTVPLSGHKWQNTHIPFFINFQDKYGSFTENYSPLKINALNPAENAPSVDRVDTKYVTNIALVSTAGDGTITNYLSAKFSREPATANLPLHLSGAFRGSFIPTEIGDTGTMLVGDVNVNDPAHFPRDINFGYFTVVEDNQVKRVAFEDNYYVSDTSGDVLRTRDSRVTKVDLSSDPDHVFGANGDKHGIMPIAVVPELSPHGSLKDVPLNDNRIRTYIGHSINDSVTAIGTYGNKLTGIDLQSELGMYFEPTSGTLQSAQIFGRAQGSTSRHGPTSISVDGDGNYWLALSASSMILKIDGQSGNIKTLINEAEPGDANKTYTTTNTAAKGLYITESSSGVFNLYEPTIVETDKSNNVWVAYTNPLSSFIKKYDSDGALLATINYASEGNQGIVPTAMVVDTYNNLWVTTTNKMRNTMTTMNTRWHSFTLMESICASLQDPGKNGIDVAFKGMSLSGAANHIVELSGFGAPVAGLRDTAKWPTRLYNGRFLIDSVTTGAATSGAWSNILHLRPQTARLQALSYTETLSAQNIYTHIRFQPSDGVFKYSHDGTKLYEVSGFFDPSYITLDNNQNAWVGHNIDTVTKITTGGVINYDSYKTTSDNNKLRVDSGPTFFDNNRGALSHTVTSDKSHFGGLSFDTYDNLLAINSYEGKLFRIPVSNISLSGSSFLYYPRSYGGSPDYHGVTKSPANTATNYHIYGIHRTAGDWTGYGWLNKYHNGLSASRMVPGSATLTVLPSGGKYDIAKVNEDFDPSETIKSYRFQNFLYNYPKFWDDFLGTIVGTISSDISNSLGRVTYEKIANFTGNHVDIDTCNIDQFYALCESIDTGIEGYNHNYPGGLGRAMNLLSIPHKKLWGTRSRFNRDFDIYGNLVRASNLGTELDTVTAIVTAGEYIVAEQLYGKQFKLINPMYVDTSTTDPGISAKSLYYDWSTELLSAYPLSAFNTNWGWGLGDNIDSANIATHFNFYEYSPAYSEVLVERVIDWENSYNNIQEDGPLSGIDAWKKDGGIVDDVIDFELRKGLGLFSSTLSGALTGIQ